MKKFLTIQILTGFAQWIDIFLIFSIPSFVWRSPPTEIALIAACFGFPSLILGPFIGVLVDRIDPRKMAFAGAIARSLLSIAIAFAPTSMIFAAFVLLKGLANLLYWPATSVLTNHVVTPSNRMRFFSNLSAFDQLTKTFTPLLAGLLVVFIGSQEIFIFSAGITLLCAFLLNTLAISTISNEEKQVRAAQSILSDLLFGFRSFKSLPLNLIASLLLGIGISFALAIYDPHLAAFLESYRFDSTAFSIILSSTAAGAVAGASFVRFVLPQASPIGLMRWGVFLFSSAVTGVVAAFEFFQAISGISLLSALWFINGMGYELFLIGSRVNTQALCPRNLLGRISTSTRSIQMLAIITAPSIGAALISSYTRLAPFTTAAIIALMLFVFSITALSFSKEKSSLEANFLK